ncbi:hypothetical protein BDY24DRAFT_276729 [Mrakia frigida]|uniref:O-fucosyltransferase family protein n=1 Tax=Mrakia frigida TaxID=29902 RepID=UPI003FCC02B9
MPVARPPFLRQLFGRQALARLFFLLLLSLLLWGHFRLSPDYSSYWLQEEHDSEVLEKSGRIGNLVSFRQLRGAGFNNQVKTLVLSHLVSILSPKHTYVPPPIFWQPRGLQPVPLSAFLDLPPHPSERYFDRVCPNPKRVNWSLPESGMIKDQLAELLEREKGERCLVVEGDRVVQWSWLESDDFLELFPQYSKDFLPTVRFGDRVLDATTRSIGRLSLGDLDDVLAVHLRRGDFKQHCPFLFASQSSFTGWNRLVPPPLGLNATSMSSFIEHCYPTVTQMVSSIERHLASRPSNSKPVRTLYVLHDFTHKPWLIPHLRMLELELVASPRSTIRRVRSSSDLHLPWQDRDLMVVVDMEIARRAGGGFIANGWSSLSGAVVGWRQMEGGKGGVGFW